MDKTQVTLVWWDIPGLEETNFTEPDQWRKKWFIQNSNSSQNGSRYKFACISVAEGKEFSPTSAQLVKHPLALVALVPKVATLFVAGAVAGSVTKTGTAPLDRIKLLLQAIERRSRLREGEGLQTGSPILEDQQVHYSFLSTPRAPLSHITSMICPKPTVCTSRSASIGKVPKLLLDITNKKDEDSGCSTPQKMLLNSIDIVEKVAMEKLRKLKRTPSSRKAERETRVRTLMWMR